MGLLSTPLTLNDGTADHIYEYQGQVPNTKSLIGRYFIPASDGKAVINAKNDLRSKTLNRMVIQFTDDLLESDGVTKSPATVNFSVTFKKTVPALTAATFLFRCSKALILAVCQKLCQGYV